MLRCFSRVLLFETLQTLDHQAPLSMGFSSQEYWSGLPCPPPGDLPHSEIAPQSPVSPALQVGSLPPAHQGSPLDRASPPKAILLPAPGTHGQVSILNLLAPLGTDGCVPELLLLSGVGGSLPLKVPCRRGHSS